MHEQAGVSFGNVTLVRGANAVFAGLTCELQERRIGLIGNNGSGKSSFLRLCNGLLLPDTGQVSVCGLETRASRKQLPEIAGFLFQNPDHQIIFPTVGEEIGFGLRERAMVAGDVRAAVAQCLDEHGCADWMDRPVHELSDGQKQLVCIMAVTIVAPKLLLLDEPFASLDLPTRHDLMHRLDAMPQQIIMASHDLDLLAGFDRLLWFEERRIREDGPARHVIAAYRDAYSPMPLVTQ